jgi:hypothetical protein
MIRQHSAKAANDEREIWRDESGAARRRPSRSALARLVRAS